MKFKVTLAGGFFATTDASPVDKQMTALQDLGFRFEEKPRSVMRGRTVPGFREFGLVDDQQGVEMEIATLEDLLALVDKVGCELLVDRGAIIVANDHLG